MTDWKIYRGTGKPNNKIEQRLPDPPPWRKFVDPNQQSKITPGIKFLVDQQEIDTVNAALYLRRPLLLTGKPGVGKSSLAYAVAHELNLGGVLVWAITSRSTLRDALYLYDAIGRLQEGNLPGKDAQQITEIGNYVTLGPLGTALADSKKKKPRVLLIDEIDKSDFDLPNDLLNLFEEGWFEIPELARYSREKVKVQSHNREKEIEIPKGRVICEEFPFVVLTSNGERELPPPFLRRCLHLEIEVPNEEKLKKIVETHLGQIKLDSKNTLLDICKKFVDRRNQQGYIATDQLLNAIYLLKRDGLSEITLTNMSEQAQTDDEAQLLNVILKSLEYSER